MTGGLPRRFSATDAIVRTQTYLRCPLPPPATPKQHDDLGYRGLNRTANVKAGRGGETKPCTQRTSPFSWPTSWCYCGPRISYP